MEGLGALGDIIFIFLYWRAEWIKTKNLMAGIDSCLWIKVTALWSFPCLYREAIRLQCFPPTRYVSGRGHAHISTWRPLPDLLNIAIYGACFIIWLYYACRYTVALSLGLSPTMRWYPDDFFSCLVCWLACYTLSYTLCRKNKEVNK